MTELHLTDSLLPRRSSDHLRALSRDLAGLAQNVYDAWDQSADGFDEEYGSGGICQDIASGIADALAREGFDVAITFTTIGDNHVYVVAALTDGVWTVDIPPSLYETGGGYNWTKRQGVTFEEHDIQLLQIDPSIISGDELADRFSE